MPIREGSWPWIVHRFTAILLLALLGAHFWVVHFVPESAILSFGGVSARLQSVLFWIIDYGLMLTGLYHGLNGVRNVAMDYWPRSDRGLSLALILVGAVAAVYGGQALTVFIGNPLV